MIRIVDMLSFSIEPTKVRLKRWEKLKYLFCLRLTIVLKYESDSFLFKINEKKLFFPSPAHHAVIPRGAIVWSVKSNNVQNPFFRDQLWPIDQNQKISPSMFIGEALLICALSEQLSKAPTEQRRGIRCHSFLRSKTRPFLRVKALWANSKIISGIVWSSPSPQWGLGWDKAAITHAAADVVGVDAIYNRHCYTATPVRGTSAKTQKVGKIIDVISRRWLGIYLE